MTEPGQGKRLWVVLLRARADAGLSDLPVVGTHIPRDVDVRLKAMMFIGASDVVKPKKAAQVNALLGELNLPDALLKLSEQEDTAKARFGVVARIGKEDRVLQAPPLQRKEIIATSTATSDDELTRWYPVDKVLGPLRLDRIGVRYADATVWVLTDASLTVSALTVSGRGMGLGFPSGQPTSVRPTIGGLGLSWSRKPVEVTGALVYRESPGYELLIQGGASITTPALVLAAVGGYAKKIGHEPSVFVFGRLAFGEGKGIGPVYFRVTGASAGFGYNSSVAKPTLTEVDSFPLMPGAVTSSDPLALLGELQGSGGGKAWISEADNRIWIAGGIEFDSFKFLSGSVLALAEFSTSGPQRFMIMLLGRAGVDFPRKAKDGIRYAHVELTISASYDTTTDTVEVFAALSPGSFVVHPSCELTGQAALCVWFGRSAHPGDFVVSLGGYHPKFSPPVHYPKPQRLALQWSVSDTVSVRGECYGALTHSAFMVGASIDVTFHAGPIRAWLSAGFDALVQWDPFHYEVAIRLSVGVAIDIWPGFHGSVSVSLDVWGPPTGGLATIHVLLWDFDIRFGDARPAAPELLKWEQFAQRSLPAPVVRSTPTAGLLPGAEATSMPKESAPWLVDTDGFRFTTQSAVPVQEIRLGDATEAAPDLPDGELLSVRPVGIEGRLRSTHRLRVKHKGAVLDLRKDGWDVQAAAGGVPDALWGDPVGARKEPPLSGSTAPRGVVGLLVSAPTRKPDDPVVRTSESKLGNEPVSGPPVPIRSDDPADPSPTRPGTVRDDIAAHLVGSHGARCALLDALHTYGIYDEHQASHGTEDLLSDYGSAVRAHLRAEPMLSGAGGH
ncbi:DUF6603 domain-containing protein [Saccharopolyspora spinosa]|uniref:DUF6603 domain-containing protein n=1 Tax=Saccharopolyspora spinosa TaxID=60894 RepID=A0A2N3Y6Q0_SACSN|nr:DUF6603 domain-containing protein [Saccharopolyspora spinosa]PKW18548.1 hypothetical protein A8926_6643 [Saccharopolyspora spinosa]